MFLKTENIFSSTGTVLFLSGSVIKGNESCYEAGSLMLYRFPLMLGSAQFEFRTDLRISQAYFGVV
jgi:hypothetical protein